MIGFELGVAAACEGDHSQHAGLWCSFAGQELARRGRDLAALTRKVVATIAEVQALPDEGLAEIFLFGRDGLQHLAMDELERRRREEEGCVQQ